MASVLPSGEIRFADGRILYNDTPITGKDFIELTQLLPQLVPAIGRAGLVGFPFGGGGGGGAGPQGPPGPRGLEGPTSSGTISSGSVGSGALASGAVQGFFGATPNIASGTVGALDFGSGAVIAGTVGSGAVVSGNVASGQISDNHFSSGAIVDGSRFSVDNDFFTASEDIVALAYATSPVAQDLSLPISSGNFILGGVVQARSCSSGRFPAIGLIVGNVSSGDRVKVYHKGLVYSSGFSPNPSFVNYGPDNLGRLNIAGGGAIVGGTPETVVYQTMARHLGSGFLWLGTDFRQVGEAFVGFGMIASGSIDNVRLGSGAVRSGHIASGAIATFSRDVLEDGIVAEELISGVCCVRITASGGLQVAMASVSGRMPADGIAIGTPASMNSGTVASFIRMGRVLLGFLEPAISGKQGSRIWVGASGQIVTISGTGGGIGVGPTNSGAQGQMMGRVGGSGEIVIDADNTLYSGEAVITTDSRFWPL